MAVVRKEPLNHAQIILLGNRWLRNQKNCGIVCSEMGGSNAEKPDIIGWNSSRSTLIEVKTSRADFLADAKKKWRLHPEKGMGYRRYYLCPEGLIRSDEIPEKWGLLYVRGSTQIKQIKDTKPFEEYDVMSEMWMVVAAARRIQAGCPYIAKQLGIDRNMAKSIYEGEIE